MIPDFKRHKKQIKKNYKEKYYKTTKTVKQPFKLNIYN